MWMDVLFLAIRALHLTPYGWRCSMRYTLCDDVAAYLTELSPRRLLQKKLHEAILLARARLEEKSGEPGNAWPLMPHALRWKMRYALCALRYVRCWGNHASDCIPWRFEGVPKKLSLYVFDSYPWRLAPHDSRFKWSMLLSNWKVKRINE